MSSQQLQLPVASSSSSCRPSIFFNRCHLHWSSNKLPLNCNVNSSNAIPYLSLNCHRPQHYHHHHHRRPIGLVRVDDGEGGNALTATAVEDEDPTPEDLEYISQIKTVLELLKKNRDMLFGEVKLTIMIEDPREVERRRLLGIDDSDAPTRDDLAAALEDVNEGRVPRNRIALQMLAGEMTSWPNLEVETSKQNTKGRSLYAKATDTGIDPDVAAKRLNVDWDTAAEIDEEDADDTEVPSAVGS